MSEDTFLGGAAARTDYWRVYEASFDAMQIATAAEMERHPVFGPILQAMPPELKRAQQEDSRRKLASALVGDGWLDYQSHLKLQGVTYARMNVDLGSWHDLVRMAQRHLTPRLVAAYSAEPQRMTSALSAMMEFMDRVMVAIGEAYLNEKQSIVDEQRQLAERRADDLRESERAFREQATLLDAILNSLAEAVIVTASDGTTLLTDQAARTMYPTLDPARNLDHEDATTFEPDGTPQPPERRTTQRALAGESIDDRELFVRFRSYPRPLHIIASARPLSNEAGEVVAAVVTSRDITDKRRLEAIQKRAGELEAQATHSEEASRLKSEFLANMSHELRTPLNVIMGFTELLARGEVSQGDPDYAEVLQDILNSSKHLLQLINDVLDLSKVDAGKLDFFPQAIELDPVLAQTVHILRGRAAEKRIHLIAEPFSGEGEAFADQHRLLQILYNYVANALKFTPEGGSVTLRALQEGAGFRIEVEDTGIGISDEDTARLFVEFQQLDAGADKAHAGTGLGLALCRKLAEAQGGSVGVRSVVNVGSVFHVWLPRHVADPTRLETSEGARRPNIGARCVLLVEDNQRDREGIARPLRLGGYEITATPTAAGALVEARKRKFDAIVLDWLLPDGTGMDVLALIKAEGTNATTPVIVVSVLPDANTVRAQAIADWLPKPIEPSSLLKAIARVVLPAQSGLVMVVDDDPLALRLMEATLRHLGYTAVCHADPREALRDLAGRQIDAIVLDLLMPEMDGFEFFAHLKTDPRQCRVPVIIWTSKDLTANDVARLGGSNQRVAKGNVSGLLGELKRVLGDRRADGVDDTDR